MKPFALAIMVLACAGYARAQIVLTDDTQGQTIQKVDHLRDANGTVDIKTVSSYSFEPLNGEVSLGYDNHPHWFRFDVTNRSSRTNWFLEVAFPLLDHVEFYSVDAEGKWSLKYSGDLYKLSTRAVKHRNFVFPFTIRTNTKEVFYVKVQTTSAVQAPLKIWSPEGLRDNGYTWQFAHGLFYGIMLIMFCYNLFLYISIRDISILYYAATLLTGGLITAYFNGFGFFYINPESPELNKLMGAMLTPLFVISSVALTRSFLELKRFSFWLDRVLVAIAVTAVIFALLTLGFGDYISRLPQRIVSLANFIVILISAIYCFTRKFRPARYFLLAWIGILVLGILLLLRNVGVIEKNFIVDNALYFGGSLQVLLISFAFGDRFNTLQRENLEAKERELRREQEEKERLEREVLIRTEEIRLKNAQLEESNNIKNKLFSIVSHDLRGPLISLQGVLDMVEMNSLSQADMKRLTDKVGVRLHHTADFLDNLLQWSRIQMAGEKFAPAKETFALQDLLTSSTQLLRADAERKKITLNIIAPTVEVYADQNMMQTVVRNLVSNAIKFTNVGGQIDVTASQRLGYAHVLIADNGVGIPEDQLSKLFTLNGISKPGTQLEKGTGIGLAVCKEFVERNGGTIKVRSVVKSGTTFEFTIPASTMM